MAKRDGVQLAVGLSNFESRGFAGFNFIEDAIVNMLQRGHNDLGETVAVLAGDVNAGFQSRFPRLGQQGGSLGAEPFVGRVQCVQQQQVTEVKYSSPDFGEIQIRAVPKRIGAAMVKKRPPPAIYFGHHIGVRSWSAGCRAQKSRINLMSPAIVENKLAEGVLAHQARSEKRE